MIRVATILICSLLVAACGSNSSGQGAVEPVNSAPTAEDSSYTTSEIAVLSGTAVATDVDGDALTFEVTSSPTKGTLTEFSQSTGEFSYTPDPAQDGVDSFHFTASDGVAITAAATVTIEIFKWAETPRYGTVDWDISDRQDLLIGSDGSFTFSGRTNLIPVGAIRRITQVWVKRVDRRGRQLWAWQIGGSEESTSGGLMENRTGDGFFFLEATSGTVYSFDNDGNVIWTSQLDFGTQTVEQRAYSGTVDLDGSIYLISADATSFFVSKMSPMTGEVLWQRRFGSTSTGFQDPFIADTSKVIAGALDVNSSGNLILVGFFVSAHVSQSRDCSYCPFVASLNSSGDSIWVREPESFKTNCGSVYEQGFFSNVVVRSDDTFYATGSSDKDEALRGQISYFNADGSEEIWSKCHGPDGTEIGIYNRALPTNDGVVIYAREQTLSPNSRDNLKSHDIYLAKYDIAGRRLWKHRYRFFRDDGAVVRTSTGAIVGDAQEVMYATVSSDGNVDGDATERIKHDVYILRFDRDGNLH